MKVGAGRVLFFDALADEIRGLIPGQLPTAVGIKAEWLATADLEDLALAFGRLGGLRPVLASAPDSVAGLSAPHDVLAIDLANRPIVLAGKKTPKRTVYFNYAGSAPSTVFEVSMEPQRDRLLIESALRRLFRARGRDLDPLALPRFLKRGFIAIENDFALFEAERMIDWSDPRELEAFCHRIAAGWRYDEQEVDGGDVFSWLNQFREPGLVHEAIQLLVYLRREGFVKKSVVEENIAQLYDALCDELLKSPTAVAIQAPGKSEQLLAYRLRKRRIRLKPFEEEIAFHIGVPELTANWVCIDDVIGSGKSILDYLFSEKNNKCASDLQRLFKEKRAKVNILVSHADARGMTRIQDDERCHNCVTVRPRVIIDDDRRVFTPSSRVLHGLSDQRRELFREFCTMIGERVNPGNPLGWDDGMWCVAFEYSVPNASLPLLYTSESKTNIWQPLFRRRRH